MSTFTDWLRSHLQDYGQLVEKGAPLNNQFQQLKSNVSQNVPPTAAFRDPSKLAEWSQAAALNAPNIGAIRAWHGSPHKFTQFKDEAIGSGEGAQAFGMGHYSGEDVAALDSHYRKRLIEDPNQGFMYELNLKPDPEDLLHFDKKLSEHPQAVQSAINKVISNNNLQEKITKYNEEVGGSAKEDVLRGEDLYTLMNYYGTASKELKALGVPGHSFPGQGGQGKPNYVMYDPADIEIKRRIKGGLDSPVKGFVDYIKGKTK
jgi:hypothetical protein